MGLPSFFRITVYFHTVYMNVHKISKRCAVGWDLLYLKVIVFPNVGSKKTAIYSMEYLQPTGHYESFSLYFLHNIYSSLDF